MHPAMRKTVQRRLCPTQQHQRLLDAQLGGVSLAVPPLLAQRRDVWDQRQEALRLSDQQATWPTLKAMRPRSRQRALPGLAACRGAA
jgi:hypothetical protein